MRLRQALGWSRSSSSECIAESSRCYTGNKGSHLREFNQAALYGEELFTTSQKRQKNSRNRFNSRTCRRKRRCSSEVEIPVSSGVERQAVISSRGRPGG